MKLEEMQDVKISSEEQSHGNQETNGYMEVNRENSEDVFQAKLYNYGVELMKTLEELGCVDNTIKNTYEHLCESLGRLRNFRFNIGFAGGMSSGKSTVINSLLEYPLMPTCKLTTTCVGTHIFYGEHPKITVVDDDTEKQVMTVDCRNISEAQFQKLKEYACITTKVKLIENLQHFTSLNLFDDKDALKPDMLEMYKDNPNHVIILLMILLTVYVDQNSNEKSQKALVANKKREEVLKFFHFNPNTVNYTIKLQWNGEFLKSGMAITDLPGLGAYAPDKDMGEGKVLKGHDSISTEAIKNTDVMVFLVDPELDAAGVPALEAMMSNADLKEAVTKEDLVIPVINKIDGCKKSEINQAIEKFMDILKNTGLNKKEKDIHLYSAWYGEYAFSDIPDDRKCFFFRNFEDFQEVILEEEEELSEKELYCKVIERSRKKLKWCYENKSHIQELKEFFRVSYLRKSKNRRSQSVILAMRELASEIIIPRKSLLDNYENLHGIAGNIIEDILRNLKNRVDVPIANALEAFVDVDHKDYYVTEKLEDIPSAYSLAFGNALDDYKSRNLRIVNTFETAFIGFSNNARIDVVGSANYRRYHNLCEEMEKIGVDVKDVNQKFRSILSHVTNETERMYRKSLGVMSKLKVEIPNALDSYMKEYEKVAQRDDPTLRAIKALRNTIVEYMTQQIDMIEGSMKVNQNTVQQSGQQTVAEILDLNTKMINFYSNSVIREVRSARSNGTFFKSREYILIDGTGGLKELFKNLKLSEKDRQYMEGEVQLIGIKTISNNLNSWYQDAENTINREFIRLRKKINNMLDNTVSGISENADDIKKKQENLTTQLQSVEKCFAKVRTNVQQEYQHSVDGIDNHILCQYKDNIFEGILEA